MLKIPSQIYSHRNLPEEYTVEHIAHKVGIGNFICAGCNLVLKGYYIGVSRSHTKRFHFRCFRFIMKHDNMKHGKSRDFSYPNIPLETFESIKISNRDEREELLKIVNMRREELLKREQMRAMTRPTVSEPTPTPTPTPTPAPSTAPTSAPSTAPTPAPAPPTPIPTSIPMPTFTLKSGIDNLVVLASKLSHEYSFGEVVERLTIVAKDFSVPELELMFDTDAASKRDIVMEGVMNRYRTYFTETWKPSEKAAIAKFVLNLKTLTNDDTYNQ